MNSKDFLIGSLIGGIVGASVALLFAPKSGKEMRDDLNEGATQVRDRAMEWKDMAYDKGNEFSEKAKQTTADWSKNVSDKSQQLSDKVKSTVDGIKYKQEEWEEVAEDVAEEVAEAIEEAAEELHRQQEVASNTQV
ncbi:hypothetical protein N784_02145 [Pontibacillus litoralis JSM 072002]|uniref:General stress protein n=1 Tax=Pontibacillus litoralis JSM 072002 TaxID=1385512 RepID=A0A0A5GAV0_9BACI|nr:hypothetical protein N784_02145 [Pontibacillus litoralis JSM 072002]